MAYVPVPKDLTKVMFNLTKRQLICFSAAAIVAVPVFFLLKDSAGSSTATMVMILAALPFFLLAMYEKNGQPLEKIIYNIIRVSVLRPKQRPYKTNNFYAVLERQEQLDKEVYRIVHRKEKAPSQRRSRHGTKAKAQADPKGTQANRSGYRPGESQG